LHVYPEVFHFVKCQILTDNELINEISNSISMMESQIEPNVLVWHKNLMSGWFSCPFNNNGTGKTLSHLAVDKKIK